LLFAAWCAGLARSSAQSSDPAPPTNVILVTTDDLDAAFEWDLRRPDTREYAYPNLRSLRDRGVEFRQSFVSLPLCSPSRASILTGRYAHNHGVVANYRDASGFQALVAQPSIASELQAAHVRTVMIGKFLNGYSRRFAEKSGAGSPSGWDAWFATFDPMAYFDWAATEDGEIVAFGAEPDDYAVDVLSRKAASAIAACAEKKQSFFLMLNLFAPHDGKPGLALAPVPAPRHSGVFQDYALPANPAFDEADLSDKLAALGEAPRLSAAEQLEIQRRARARRETMLSVDEGLGVLFAKLRELDLERSTTIVFTSDNGMQQGEHRLPGGKGWAYDESLRVPLLAAGPSLPSGTKCDALVLNVDLAPTVLELFGVSTEREMDGRSWLSVARDPKAPWRKDMLVNGPRERWFEGVRTATRVYVEHDRDRDGEVEATELYFVGADEACPDADPHQLVNRAEDPRFEAVRAQLHARLVALRACSGANCW